MKWLQRLRRSRSETPSEAKDSGAESPADQAAARVDGQAPAEASQQPVPAQTQTQTQTSAPPSAPRPRNRGRRPATMGKTLAEQNYLAEAATRAKQSR